MGIQLSEHFTFKKLLKFVYPSIIMMIFTSIYSVVDGLFVSNFVGKTALAAINLILALIKGSMRLIAASAVLPTKFDTNNPSTTLYIDVILSSLLTDIQILKVL